MKNKAFWSELVMTYLTFKLVGTYLARLWVLNEFNEFSWISALTASVALWPWIQEMWVAGFVTLGDTMNVVVPQFPINRMMRDTSSWLLALWTVWDNYFIKFCLRNTLYNGHLLSVGPLNDAVLKKKDGL